MRISHVGQFLPARRGAGSHSPAAAIPPVAKEPLNAAVAGGNIVQGLRPTAGAIEPKAPRKMLTELRIPRDLSILV